MSGTRPVVLRMALTVIGGGVGISLVLIAVGTGQPSTPVVWAVSPDQTLTHTTYIPLVMGDYVPPSGRLCRFGVGAESDIALYDVNGLRIGWYVDWTATLSPARPGGITYMPMIRLRQGSSDSYTYSPDGSVLSATVANNPGAIWLIGNEPDRRRWQDSLEPHLYARAYHELYYLLKNLDPTAQVAAGGIVQPTPLRLQYLDMVLDSYREQFGEPMPVDVWNIHAFILRERSCDCHPEDCWGAEIPPGIDECDGMLYDIQDNDNLEIFKEHIVRFRQWMAERGYQDRPLVITEFGVQMWPDYGFPPDRVNAFMNATFDYLMTVTSTLGYPADDYRLVQRWAWYSLADDHFNGWLFDPVTQDRTVFGDNFAAYTSQVAPEVNLRPIRIWSNPLLPLSAGEPVTIVLYAQVVNNGHTPIETPVRVRFYEGDPSNGGTPIGPEQTIPYLDGCASAARAQITWRNVSPGLHRIFVVVDPLDELPETNEDDNVLSTSVLVASRRIWLPVVLRFAEQRSLYRR